MKQYDAHKSSLFLMELILAIVIFALTSAVCLQLFVKAHVLSEDARALNHAVNLCVSAAEGYRESNGDRAFLQEIFPELIPGEKDTLEACYTKDFEPCSSEEAAYVWRLSFSEAGESLEVSVTETASAQVIYSLGCDVYVPET